MLHDDIVLEIQNRAKKRDVLTHYCGRALHCKGDRGAPDLILVGHYGVAWVEVKTGGAGLETAQTTWMHALKASGQTHYIIGEKQLGDGTLDALLDNLIYGQSVLFRDTA